MLKGITSNGIEAYADLVHQIVRLITNNPNYTAYKEVDLGTALREVRRLLQTQSINPPITEWEQNWEALQRSQQPAPQPTQSLPSTEADTTTAVVQAAKPQVFVQQPIADPVPQAPVASGIQTARARTAVMPPQSASVNGEAQELNPTVIDGKTSSDCQRRGEAIVAVLNRVKGTPEIRWDGYSLGPQVEVHRLVVVDDGKSEIKLPSAATYGDWRRTLKHKSMVPKGAGIVFRECYGHIAMEIPHGSWEPIEFLNNPWIAEAHQQWAQQQPLPYDPYKVWCGVDQSNGLFELNLDSPATAAHIGIAGSTGGGKNGVASVIIYGSTRRYQPNFVKFVLVDVQRINFQFFGEYHPYLWGGLGILSEEEEITRVFGFSTSAEEKQGLLFAEAERRKRLFSKARVDNLRDYNRAAYQDFCKWCKQMQVHPLQQGGLDRYNLEVLLRPEIGLPILERIAIVIDEVAAVGSLYANSKRSFDDWVRKICQELRKFGFHFIGMTQDPAADADGAYKSETRSQFGNLIGLSCNRPEVSERAIGKGFTDCTELSGNGDSYVLTPNQEEPYRVQWFWVSPEIIEQQGQRLSTDPKFQAARTVWSKQQQTLLAGVNQSQRCESRVPQSLQLFDDPGGEAYSNPSTALPSSPEEVPSTIALSDSERQLWESIQQKFLTLMGLDSNNAILVALFGNKEFRKLGELKTLLAKLPSDPRAQQLYQKIESRRSR